MNISESGKSKYSETKRLIRYAMAEKQLVLFVGAGASVDAGMPLWNAAVEQIAEKLNLNEETFDNTIIPQYYYNARGQKEYTQLMREIFRYNNKLYPQPVHKAIIRFDTDTIITTNYDHLIEQAAEDNGEFLQVISQDIDLPYRKSGKELIKMHGDFEHDNFVLKEDDYLHYHRNFKLIENYVKSLIGTKTVLFIGYSLGDPDVKHIFSWVKEILDEHFQRAYLIVTGRTANQNEIDYYRHLGVNLIYSTELVDETAIKKEDHSGQLLETLEYILYDEVKEKGMVDSLYDSLKPFTEINYTYLRYIEKAFNRLRSKINDHITLRVENDNYLEHSDDHAAEEDITFLNELDLASERNSKDLKIQAIFEALRKSAVRGTGRVVKGDKGLRDQKKDFSEHYDTPKWIEAIQIFDYKTLNELKEFNSKILSESKPELYMQQAYISAFLMDYLTAYYCLDNAATYFYRKREYAWYYIALWNKRNIAQVITVDFFYNCRIDKDILESIKTELSNMDLEQTLQTIPDLGNENNQFLKDLKDFKFASDLFYDVVSTSIKASKQAAESYFLFAGMPAYEQMRRQVYDYYNYGTHNYLLVDRYKENNEIYNLFARSIFGSASAPDKDTSSESIFGSSGNVHADDLNDADIHLILRYIKSAELRKLYSEFNISAIAVDEKGKEYLKDIIKNIPEIFELRLYGGNDIFWRYMCFVSHTNIECDIAGEIIKTLVVLPQREYVDNRRDSLVEFINAMFNQKLYSDAELCNEAQKLTKRLIDIISEQPSLLSFYKNPIISLIAFGEEGGYLFDDEESIRKILSEDYYLLLPYIYNGCSENIKEIIKGHFADWECPDSGKGYRTYAELVLAEIIDPDEAVEGRALSFLEKHNEGKKQGLEMGIHSVSEDDLEGYLVNLFLSEKFNEIDKLKEQIATGDDEFSKWLIDGENYDYDKFELTWLKHCYPHLLQTLSENDVIKESMISLYKQKYPTDYIDKKTTDIIVKYFI